MKNPFDAFDQPAGGSGNPFDEFDSWVPMPPERPAELGIVRENVPLPPPRPAGLTSAAPAAPAAPVEPPAADVPLPPRRPPGLGVNIPPMPPVQPLADEMKPIPEEPEIDPSSGQWTGRMIPGAVPSDPQGLRPAPGGRNNALNRVYKALGIDPRSDIDTGAAYDESRQKVEGAGKAYDEAAEAAATARAREDEQMRRLEAAAAKGNTFAADRLAVLKQQRAAGAVTDTQAAEYEADRAREGKVKADLTGPAITNTGRNMVESVPRTIGNQAVDTGAAASRIFQKVLEPLDAITGIDTKVKDQNREEYWARRRRAVEGAFASDPALADTFGQQVVDGLASTAGFVGAGLAGRAVGLGAKLTTAVAGALPQGEQSWRTLDEFYRKNPELDAQWKRWTNFAIGLGSGASEAAPIGHLFSRLENLTGGGVTRLLGIAAAQGGEEGAQEALQKLIENAQKQWFIDPRAPITEDVAQNALVGAIVGAGMAGTGGAAKMLVDGMRVDGRIPAPPDLPQELPPELQPGSPAAPAASPAPPPAVQPPSQPTSGPPPAAPDTPPEAPADEGPVEPPPAPASRATPEQDALLRGAGYTPEQIAEMGDAELAAAVEEEQAAGTQPLPIVPPNGSLKETQGGADAQSEPGVQRVAADKGALPEPEEQELPGVRGTRDNDVSGVGQQLPGVPGSRGPTAQPETLDRQDRRNAGVRPGQREVGDSERAGAKSADVRSNARASGAAPDDRGVGTGNRDTSADTLQSDPERMAGREGADGAVRDDAEGQPPSDGRRSDADTAGMGPGEGASDRDASRAVEERVAAGEGTRSAPVKVQDPADIEVAAQQVDTSPSEGQKSAGNYKHGHLRYGGFDIAIETPKGATRTGKDPDGNEWSTQMPAHYGRIKRSRGADGDQIDVYIGDKPENGKVWVIDQFDPKTGRFDEHKSFVGVDSEAEALAIYDAAFSDGSGPSRRAGIREMTEDYFRSWIDRPGKRTTPITLGGKERAAAKAEAPATPDVVSGGVSSENAPAPPLAKPQRVVVGKNRDGLDVWEDQNGVRSVVSEGIRRTENVAVRPDGTRAVDPSRRSPEFQTVEEGSSKIEGDLLNGDADVVAPADSIREGKLPVEDDRERQRLENVRKLEAMDARPKDPVAAAFFDHLVKGGSFPNILQARKMAREAAGIDDAKVVEEAMELAVVSAAKVLIEGRDELEAFDKLVDLYKRQPNLNMRTSTSVRDQAYSTPIPLAYLAQRLAGITKDSHVLEPTAGNGALVFTANPDLVIANEINKNRGDNLEAQGYTVTEYDAASEKASGEWRKMGLIEPNGYFNVVIANPPFGPVKDDKGESKVFDLNDTRAGYTTTQIDHAISMRAIARMEPKTGRAVLIIGGPAKTDNRAEAYNGQQKRAFFKTLYDLYNVTDHFTVSGDLYSRQGASWPVDVIVIEGRGKSARRLPAVDVPPVLDSWEAVKEKLNGRTRADDASTGTDLLRPDAGTGADGDAGGDRPVEQGGSSGLDAQPPQPEGVREPASEPQPEPATGVDGGPVGEPAGSDQPARPGDKPASKPRAPRVTDPDAAFDAAFNDLFGDAPAAAPAAGGPRTGTKRPTTVKGLAADAAVETAKGFDDALTGLYQLFGAGKTIGSGPVFDEETYAKAKPFFIAAVQHLKNAAKDLVEIARIIMRSMMERFGPEARSAVERMRPYITRFMGDVRDGKIDFTQQPTPPKQDEKPQDEAPAGPPKSAPQEKETDKQVAYTPTSEHGGLGTLVPINMQTAIQTALDKIAAEHGSVDKFVADELGYTVGSKAFLDAFAAEQVDAIALAISNFKKDAGFIIGDQTGIGKGRVNAAVIRWAIKNGMTPIFVTEKPNLYGDMYRDMKDIGVPDFLGREPRMFMTNTGEQIPLDADALDYLAARDLADQLGQPRPPRYGKFLSAFTSDKQKKTLNEMAATGKAGDYDVVFTTYNQMQTVKGAETERTLFLKAIAPNAVLIFDESHNAGGQEGKPRVKKGAPPPIPRSQTARDLVSLARSVFYSSATFAKRPSVMDLYSKTDMRLAVDDNIEKLAGAIKDGGVPMQQVVSTMLAEAGQYIRRERSFDGVVYDTPVVEVDREKYNDFSGALQQILQFSNQMGPAVEAIEAELAAEGEVMLEDGSTGDAGVESLNFTAVMHNLIAQYLLAAKADSAADRAIAALENGEKPVLTVASTLESFLSQFAEDNNLKPGDDIDIDFSQLLVRYLDRTRTVTIKDAYGNKKKHYLTDEELGPAGLDAYDAALQFIKDLDFGDLPISPIDHIHRRLAQAGYSSAEITGRGLIIAYRSRRAGVLRNRPPSDVKAAGRKVNIEKFNNQTPGKKDGLSTIILNQAGSTGLSLHANKTFKNQQKRVMIIVQAEANIDTHMQMLGRVHRTGQVVLPRYEQLIASIPAEKRPAAVLQKKMASLNASTTASREGALTGKDVPDFVNQYGDLIAKQWLEDNSDVSMWLGGLQLGEQKKEADPTEDGAMRKLTGRIPLLPIEEQERVYDELETRYADYLEQLEAMGGNALEAKALDLDAKIIESATMVEGKGSDSPFAAPVILSIYDVKRIGKPFSAKNLVDRLAKDAAAIDEAGEAEYQKHAEAEGVSAIEEAIIRIGRRAARAHQEILKKALEEGKAFTKGVVDAIVDVGMQADAADIDRDAINTKAAETRQRLNDNMNRFASLAGMMRPGAKIRILTPAGDSVTGVVLKLDKQGKAKNPLALGTWRVTFAAPLNNPVVTLNLSQLQIDDADASKFKVESADYEPLNTTLQLMDDLAKGGAREKRIIATGNILSGFSALKGQGQIISFTDSDGRKQPGILMPAKLKKLEDILKTINRPLPAAADVLNYITERGGGPIYDTAKNIEITSRWGGLKVRVKGAKSLGGRYYLNTGVTNAAGGDFYKSGPWMMADVSDARAAATVQALIDAGARFEAPPEPKKKPASTSQRQAEPAAPEITPEGAKLDQMVRDIVAQVVGLQNVDVNTADRIYSDDAEASARSGGPGAVGHEIAGRAVFFYEARPLVEVALSRPGTVATTAFHEAFHILQGYKAFTPQEHAILRREYPAMRATLERDGRSTTTMTGAEIEAYAFELYAMRRRAGDPSAAGFHIAVRRLFDRLLQVIERVGNALRGLGYTSAEDVFAAAFTGEVGARIGTAAQRSRSRTDYPMSVGYSTFSPRAQADIEAYNTAAGLVRPAPAPGRAPSFDATAPGAVDAGLRKVQDEFVDLRRYQQDIVGQNQADLPEGQDAYQAVAIFPGRVTSRLDDFDGDHVEPLLKEMAAVDATSDELGMALLARHARERNAFILGRDPANDAGSGLADSAADQIIAEMQASGRWQVLLPLMDRVYAMVEADRRARLASGLISQDQYLAWRGQFQFYVPLRGKPDGMEEEGGANTGAGFDVRGREVRMTLGRFSVPDNPLHNSVLQAQEGIVRSEKNRVDRALLKLVQNNPNPEVWVVNERRYKRELGPDGKVRTVQDHSLRYEPNVIGVKVGGKVTYITLKDVGLAEAFRNLPNDAARHAFTRAIGKLTRAYGQLQTNVNPDFFVVNILRDIQEANFTLFAESPKMAGYFNRFWFPSLKTAIAVLTGRASTADQQLWDEWRRNGGQIHYNAFKLIDEIKKDMADRLGENDGLTARNAAAAGALPLRLLLRGLAIWNETMENATRLAVFRAARKAGYSSGRAARLAREATVNFTRRGQWTTTIGAYKVFFNPAVQGAVKMAQQLTMPKDATPRQIASVRRARMAVAALPVLSSMLTLWNLYAAGDDEDDKLPGGPRSLYMAIPEYEREKSIIFVYGRRVENGKLVPRYLKLPVAFGLGIPVVLGEQATLLAMRQTTAAKAAASTLKSVTNAFNPLGSGSWLNMLAPTLLGLPIDLYTNRDWTGRPIVPPEQRYNQGIPRSDQFFSNTNQGAIDLARELRDGTGGAIDLYPGWITYSAGWVSGGLGRFLKHGWDTAKNAGSGVETPIERMPFLRKFMGAVDLSAEQNLYFQNRQSVIEQNNKVVSAKRTLDRNPDDRIAARDLDEGAAALGLGLRKDRFVRKGSLPDVYDKTDKALKDHRDRIGELRRDRGLSASQRENEIRKVRELMDTLMRSTRRDAASFPGAAR